MQSTMLTTLEETWKSIQGSKIEKRKHEDINTVFKDIAIKLNLLEPLSVDPV